MNENTSYKNVDDAVVRSFESAWVEGKPIAIQDAIETAAPFFRLATFENLV
ncbi:MAG: hypothetical protein OSA98_17750 [Rubripirellula sp.]|nr:hypothetical protein [Rubripirellula sp.]